MNDEQSASHNFILGNVSGKNVDRCLELFFLTQFRQLQSKDYIHSSLCQKIAYTGKLSVTSHFLHIFPWSI